MYVDFNPKTKKALKEAVAAAQSPQGRDAAQQGVIGPQVFSPGPFPARLDGIEHVEGPHYPAAHTWYAKVRVENGEIVKVLS